jgi:trehalose 6-phosphate phosphatase
LPNALRDAAVVPDCVAGWLPAVFLDYDGVLTPIVERPEDAVLSESMRGIVRDLARRCRVCVVSGRDRSVVTALMGLDDLVVAGSHGFDIYDPGSGAIAHEASTGWEGLIAQATRELQARAAAIPGALVEPKHASVAVNYRAVAPAEVARVEALVAAVLADHPGALKVTPGKLVHEIQPMVDWDKGRAVLRLLEFLGLNREDVVPVYLGDDVTDEDAFRVLAHRRPPGGAAGPACGGVGILVIDPADAPGRETEACAVLDSVDEVGRFLDGLAR